MEELKAEEVELVKNRLRRELDDATSRWSKLLKREDLPDDIKKEVKSIGMELESIAHRFSLIGITTTEAKLMTHGFLFLAYAYKYYVENKDKENKEKV